jgi:hypothetical protein
MLSYICFMHNKYTKDIESTCYIVQLKKNKRYMFWFACTATIVFRPGPVQDPGSGFWLGHRVARVNCFLKNQNDIVLVKKKSTGCNRVFDRSCRVVGSHQVFSSPVFFQSGPVSDPGLPARLGRVCFKSMTAIVLCTILFGYYHLPFSLIVLLISFSSLFVVFLNYGEEIRKKVKWNGRKLNLKCLFK